MLLNKWRAYRSQLPSLERTKNHSQRECRGSRQPYSNRIRPQEAERKMGNLNMEYTQMFCDICYRQLKGYDKFDIPREEPYVRVEATTYGLKDRKDVNEHWYTSCWGNRKGKR